MRKSKFFITRMQLGRISAHSGGSNRGFNPVEPPSQWAPQLGRSQILGSLLRPFEFEQLWIEHTVYKQMKFQNVSDKGQIREEISSAGIQSRGAACGYINPMLLGLATRQDRAL